MASAMAYISASVPRPLSAFTPIKTNRLLSFVYPALGSIRSKVAEYGHGPAPFPLTKGMPVMAHLPVQTAFAHSQSSSKTYPNFVDRDLADARAP